MQLLEGAIISLTARTHNEKIMLLKPYSLHGTDFVAFISSQKLQKVTVIENVQHLNTILIYSKEKKT